MVPKKPRVLGGTTEALLKKWSGSWSKGGGGRETRSEMLLLSDWEGMEIDGTGGGQVLAGSASVGEEVNQARGAVSSEPVRDSVLYAFPSRCGF